MPGLRPYGGRGRTVSWAVALAAAASLTLAGCEGDDDAGAGSKAAPETTAAAAATPASSSAAPAPEPSPSDSGPAASPTPTVVTLGDHSGTAVGKAVADARADGLRYVVYLQGTGASLDGGGRKASSWSAGEKICEQIDDPTDVNSSFDVAFVVARDGRNCAGGLTATPKPTKTATGTTSGGTSGGGSGSGGGSKGCELTSPAGNCYADGQFCAQRHHGLSTYGKGGEYLTCEEDAAGVWRWSDGHPG
ncbi:hypothetical protein ACIBAH_29795 [Streptomyces sp. NPDC051445]|uniref:hypothetical protein n=1 Tax=unclassified Streptomyces TaxID=2593676 RepID=UPI0037BB06C5